MVWLSWFRYEGFQERVVVKVRLGVVRLGVVSLGLVWLGETGRGMAGYGVVFTTRGALNEKQLKSGS